MPSHVSPPSIYINKKAARAGCASAREVIKMNSREDSFPPQWRIERKNLKRLQTARNRDRERWLFSDRIKGFEWGKGDFKYACKKSQK